MTDKIIVFLLLVFCLIPARVRADQAPEETGPHTWEQIRENDVLEMLSHEQVAMLRKLAQMNSDSVDIPEFDWEKLCETTGGASSYFQALAQDVKAGTISTLCENWNWDSLPRIGILPFAGTENLPIRFEIIDFLPETNGFLKEVFSRAQKIAANMTAKNRPSPSEQPQIAPLHVVKALFPGSGGDAVILWPESADAACRRGILLFRERVKERFRDRVGEPVLACFKRPLRRFVDAEAFVLAVILHRFAHMLGPFYVDDKAGEMKLIADSLGETSLPLEEIKANAVVLLSAQILKEDRVISERTLNRVAISHLAYQLTGVTDADKNPRLLSPVPELTHYFRAGALVWDVMTRELTVNVDRLTAGARKLVEQMVSLQKSGKKEKVLKWQEEQNEVIPEIAMIAKIVGGIPAASSEKKVENSRPSRDQD